MFSRELNLKLGEILTEKGKITKEQLEHALKEQKSRRGDQKRIGSYLIELGYVTEDDISNALALQFNMPVMQLEGLRIKPDVIDVIPEIMAKRFNIIPLFKVEKE